MRKWVKINYKVKLINKLRKLNNWKVFKVKIKGLVKSKRIMKI